MSSLEHDDLLAKGKILSEQISNDVEPAGGPAKTVSDDSKHQRTLYSRAATFNNSNEDE